MIVKGIATAALGIGMALGLGGTADATCVAGRLCVAVIGDVGGTPGDQCNGAYDANCEYCAQNGGNVAYPNSWCDGSDENYAWTDCSTWVAGQCVAG